jgi:hypothetical protein
LERAFRDGEDAIFGKHILNLEGLVHAGRSKAWRDLKRVEVSPKSIIFHFDTRPKRIKLSFSNVPFPLVMAGIVREQGVKISFFDGFRAPE